MKSKKILEILIAERMANSLETALRQDHEYQDTLKQQNNAFRKMDNAKLSRKQAAIVDTAISATNHCGAVYGAAAHRHGLKDGIRLSAELCEII